MKKLILTAILAVLLAGPLLAQAQACVFAAPSITLDFGTGRDVADINNQSLPTYRRVYRYCPTDGFYTYTSFTDNCFRGDWFTLEEDHTPGDAEGNLMLVNASYEGGVFFTTRLGPLKSNTIYEFGLWMMNVCRLSDKCPFPLLPNINIKLKTPSGKTVAQFASGALPRREAPHWTPYRAVFTMPAGETDLLVTMEDMNLGGCGNDFALDDITLRECIKPVVVTKKPALPQPKTSVKTTKPSPKKAVAKPKPEQKPAPKKEDTPTRVPAPPPTPIPARARVAMPPPPPALRARANPLIKQLETDPGEIKIDLYDNGEIDGDTVSIYHNNQLIVTRARLSQKAITFRITVDAAHPHHELVMVANNLGSIPPNTSLMIVTAGEKRYQVFLSSTEEKNAKVVFDLKE